MPKTLIGIFTSDASLIDYGTKFIRIYFATLGITGIQFACQNSFLALENAKISVFLALLRKVFLLLPFIYIFPHIFTNQTVAVFLLNQLQIQ